MDSQPDANPARRSRREPLNAAEAVVDDAGDWKDEIRPAASGGASHYLSEFAPLLSRSVKMRQVKAILEEVASTDATVLVRGESGVGKNLIALAIHARSARRDGPFIKVSCAALPTELLESELFGHEKGSFTGAYRRKPGQFEFANKGTIVLDEIGEMPKALQAKLLHVLQDFQFSRVGGRELLRVDVRVVATTNRDLEAAMRNGDFREDLFYRLNVVEIRVPPLREQREAIPALVEYFLARSNLQYGREVVLPAETIRLLTSYSWPGNIRELENVVRRFVVLGNVQSVQEEFTSRLRMNEGSQTRASVRPPADPVLGLKDIARRAARDAERAALLDVLARVHWNRAAAARILRVSYKTLLTKLVECNISPSGSSNPPDPSIPPTGTSWQSHQTPTDTNGPHDRTAGD